MSIRLLTVLAVTACAGVAACAPTGVLPGGPAGPGVSGPYPGNPSAFRAEDFAWSTQTGTSAVEGRVNFSRDGQSYNCTGSVGLTPDTPYTRRRFQNLYGSIELAALPEAVIRARNVADPAEDYRSFVRAAHCNDNTFRFADLPVGSWFLVTPVSAGGEDRVVLMRRVETRADRTTNVIQ
ncbi:MAG: hypothetical protein HZY74_12400 [Brevundimonas sp.]|nr:MAG: hypothetical protein HZY74_12400 [Brevundimonas sp.]